MIAKMEKTTIAPKIPTPIMNGLLLEPFPFGFSGEGSSSNKSLSSNCVGSIAFSLK